MVHASLFTGIGGFDLAAEWVGWENCFQVEIHPGKLETLQKNFPHVTRFKDVCSFPAAAYSGSIDVLSGGFPCQDISRAGRGAGLDGAKSSLWFAFEHAIRLIGPSYVVIENSPRLFVLGFERVLSGLARLGYDAKWAVVPASWYGAPHERERLYLLAYAHRLRLATPPNWPECLAENSWQAHQQEGRPAGWDTPSQTGYQAWLPALARFRGMDDGLSLELAAEELHGYGDAIVPHCAFEIFRAIDAVEHGLS